VENTEPYGQSLARSVTRLDDTLGAIRAAWSSAGEPLTHDGPFHTWNHATFALPGRQETFPPIWVAAQGPRAAAVAGRWGDGWINVHEGLSRWEETSRHMAEGARLAGRHPDQLERSLLIAGVLVSTRQQYEEACASPTMQAAALALRGSAWSAAGAEHPLGDDYPGFSGHDPSQLTAARLKELGRAVTPAVLERLMPCGSARQVADYLTRFVDLGVTHVIVINLAPTCGIRIAVSSLREQRHLIHLLKALPTRPLSVGQRPLPAGV
jgi:phthiodiolone/phenolphthiodiolone dimycocerosates ketoreductase